MIALTVTVPADRAETVADAALRVAGQGSIAYWVDPVPEDERPEPRRPEDCTTTEEIPL